MSKNPTDSPSNNKGAGATPSMEEVLRAFLSIPPPPKKAKAKKKSMRGKVQRKKKA